MASVKVALKDPEHLETAQKHGIMLRQEKHKSAIRLFPLSGLDRLLLSVQFPSLFAKKEHLTATEAERATALLMQHGVAVSTSLPISGK